ncbi:hypothetical protein GCM10009839_33950 [Catenulispora yoronensis]|uniref:Aminoglycoside phosphotransferase domain-containing protein n=1 Tax=Catenulispora yoronensis TaxID=450799 RepID=A0ABN2U8Z1_9ACTN
MTRTGALEPVPSGCRERILAHYGTDAETWLQAVPQFLAAAAARWGVALSGYHDAGHASVIARGSTCDGADVLLKAWFDERYIRETTALRLWQSGPVTSLIGCADDLQIAMMGIVGERPGGQPRPPQDAPAVAAAIAELHTVTLDQASRNLPLLSDYRDIDILPRVRRRTAIFADRVPSDCVHAGTAACDRLPEIGGPPVLLHADLYRENVLWDSDGQPVVIDPLPMIGDAAFDWAFWTVYYDLADGQDERLRLADLHGTATREAILTWSAALALDGLLFYLEARDQRVARMIEVLRGFERCRLAAVPP